MSKPVVIMSAAGPDGKTWSVPACPKCRRTCLSVGMAEECCEPKMCACGKECAKRTSCDDCRKSADEKREREQFEKATKVSWRDHSGPVVYCDRFYHDVEDFIEEVTDDGEHSLPEYVWACDVLKPSLDARQILENELEEYCEDAYEQLDDVKGLQTFLTAWCEKQTIERWQESPRTAVLLEGAESVLEENRALASDGKEPNQVNVTINKVEPMIFSRDDSGKEGTASPASAAGQCVDCGNSMHVECPTCDKPSYASPPGITLQVGTATDGEDVSKLNFKVWQPDHGETLDDAATVEAYDAEGAAEKHMEREWSNMDYIK